MGGLTGNFSGRSVLPRPSMAPLKFGADDVPEAVKPEAVKSEAPSTPVDSNIPTPPVLPEAPKEPPGKGNWLKRLMIPVFILGGLGAGAGGIAHVVKTANQAEQVRLNEQKQKEEDYKSSRLRSYQSQIRQDVLARVLPTMKDNDNKLKVLMAYVTDSSPSVRVLVAENTKFFTGPGAEENKLALLKLLVNDSSDEVRSGVARSTANLENPEQKMVLLRTLEKDTSYYVRLQVAKAAESLPTDSMKAEIVKSLIKDTNQETRRAAIILLESIKDESLKQSIFQFTLGDLAK